MIPKIVLASNNTGKLVEFERLLSPLSIQVCAQSKFKVPDCDEPFHTFVENALRKARHTARHTGLPALADDSGVCVPALHGAPGVFSARYATLFSPTLNPELDKDAQNNAQLIHNLRELADKTAYYYCVLVLVRHADDPQPIICDGQWWGRIVDVPQGANGFGYDPYFFIPELNMTAAQMDKVQKNALSHRGIAVQALIQKLKSEH
jgi:XTP/dITP diphosphohydrolase